MSLCSHNGEASLCPSSSTQKHRRRLNELEAWVYACIMEKFFFAPFCSYENIRSFSVIVNWYFSDRPLQLPLSLNWTTLRFWYLPREYDKTKLHVSIKYQSKMSWQVLKSLSQPTYHKLPQSLLSCEKDGVGMALIWRDDGDYIPAMVYIFGNLQIHHLWALLFLLVGQASKARHSLKLQLKDSFLFSVSALCRHLHCHVIGRPCQIQIRENK